jgi:hypothetical protein
MRAAPLGMRDGDRERLPALTPASSVPAGMVAQARIAPGRASVTVVPWA